MDAKQGKKRAAKFADSILNTRLRDLMKRTDTVAFADSIGVSVEAVRQWSSGYSRPDIEKVADIASFFGVTTDYLLGKSSLLVPDMDVQNAALLIGLSDKAIRFLIEGAAEFRGTLNGLLSDRGACDFFKELDTYVYALGNASSNEASEILAYKMAQEGGKEVSLQEAGDLLTEYYWRKLTVSLQLIAERINDVREGRDV